MSGLQFLALVGVITAVGGDAIAAAAKGRDDRVDYIRGVATKRGWLVALLVASLWWAA